MKLKVIAEVSFRRSEQTNLLAVLGQKRIKLRTSEVACLIAKGGNQIVFCWARTTGIGLNGKRVMVIESHRLRLTSGTWNPLRLANYAKDAGLTLDNLKLFEQHYEALAKAA